VTKFIENRKKGREPEKSIVVFYHADCTDGFTAAWAAWKKFGDKAEYIASFHEDKPFSFKNKKVYTLDMTFPESVTKRLIRDNIFVTSIDHHKSTKDITLSTHKPLFSLDNSGCVLAWNYFHSKKPIPQFLLSIEDFDIWQLKIKGTRELYAYLDLFDFNFKNWSSFIGNFENKEKRKKILDIGAIIVRYENKEIERQVGKNARIVNFEGHKVYAINTTFSTSLIGDRLCHLLPPLSVIWKQNKLGMILVSLRGDGTIDTSLIAKKYGGGGHRDASAFRLPSIKDIPWTI